MTTLTRADLAAIPAYKPGRTPHDIAKDAKMPTAIKLSSNEVPFGPLPGVAEAIAEAACTVHRYPDMFAVAFREALAAKHGVGVEQVVVGCGSVSLLECLAQACALPGDEVVFSWRSFEAYPIMATRIGATAVRVPNTADHRIDAAGLANAVTERTRLVLVCTPNNPTGAVLRGDELRTLIDAIPSDVVVAIDEAYVEFVVDSSVISGFEFLDRENIVVTRTFSKAWGMASARAGYLVGAGPVVDAVRKVLTPFSSSAFAQAGALAALQHEDEVQRRAAIVIAERDRMWHELNTRYPNLGIPPSQGNFLWLPLGDRATHFASECEKRSIIVRGFSGEGVRVTIGTAEENAAFLAAASEILSL